MLLTQQSVACKVAFLSTASINAYTEDQNHRSDSCHTDIGFVRLYLVRIQLDIFIRGARRLRPEILQQGLDMQDMGR